jgi:hypothetical protein
VCYVNLFTLLPLHCSALAEACKLLVVITLFGSSEEFTLLKVGLGLVAKILSRSILRRGQRVRAGSTCYICVLLVHLCIIKGQRYIFWGTTKPALSIMTYIVRKKFYNCVIFYFIV